MYCTNCRTEVPEGSAFCQNCGAAISLPGASQQPRAAMSRRLVLTAAGAAAAAIVAGVVSVFAIVQPFGGGEPEDVSEAEGPGLPRDTETAGLTAESEGIRLTVTEVIDPVEGAIAYGPRRCVGVGFRVNNGADFPIEIEDSDIFVAYADRFRPPEGVVRPCYVDDPRLANVFFIGHRLPPGEALEGVVGFSLPEDERVKSFIVVVGAPVPGGIARRGIRLEVPLSAVAKVPTPTPAPTPIATATPSPTAPPVAPAIGKIAFVSNRDGNREIYVMNADGSGQTRLTNNPTFDFPPAWSPDGSRIAFGSDRDGNVDIYVMNADGSGLIRLTDNPARDSRPAWSPAR